MGHMQRTILCMPWQRQPKPTPRWQTDTAITENFSRQSSMCTSAYTSSGADRHKWFPPDMDVHIWVTTDAHHTVLQTFTQKLPHGYKSRPSCTRETRISSPSGVVLLQSLSLLYA